MKKLLIYAACGAIALASCKQEKSTINPAEIQNDSLRAIINARERSKRYDGNTQSDSTRICRD